MNKADRQESDRRVRQISNWLLDGESTIDIIEFCREKWSIKEGQVYKYIEKARKVWEKINEDEMIYNLHWHLDSRRKLLNKCLKENDRTNARQILNDMADLHGLREIKVKSEHTEKHEYRLIVERKEQQIEDDGNGRFTKAKVKSLAR